MARLQTQSGGIELDETIRYPVYVSLNASSQIIAVINTGPNFISPPEGYDSWLAGPDDVALAGTNDILTMSLGHVTVGATLELTGSNMEMTASVGDVIVNSIEQWEIWVPVESESGKWVVRSRLHH